MLKSNKKKGFSLIEQLCAMSIFFILSISIITIQLNNLRLKEYNKEILIYSSILEALKQEILYNNSYDNVKEIYNSNKRYVTKEMLNISTIKNNNLNHIFSESYDYKDTYLLLRLVDGEVLKIHMEIHVKLKKEEIIECEFNKGNYL